MESDLPIYIDGSQVLFPDVQPLIIDGHVQVPVRFVAENIGANVRWDEENRKVIVERNGRSIEFYEASNDFFIHESRSMVPLRTMVEKLDLDIYWAEEHRAVIIETLF